MLQAKFRNVYFYDSLVYAHHDRRPTVLLRDLVAPLQQRIGNQETVWINKDSTEELRIRKSQIDPSDSFLTLLVQYSTTTAADPAFSDFETGEIRIAGREEGEGVAVAAHVVLALDANKNGYNHTLVEQVPGLGQTNLHKILNQQLKHCGTWSVRDGAGNQTDCHAAIDMCGHQSETLKDALEEGKIAGIELISKVEGPKKWDPVKGVVEKANILKLSVIEDDKDKIGQILNAARRYSKEHHLEMKVKVSRKIGGRQKLQTVNVDQHLNDALEAVFVRSEGINMENKIGQCEKEIHEELDRSMRNLLAALPKDPRG